MTVTPPRAEVHQMKQAVTRLSRRLGWDRNPLRRRSDRVEAAVVAGRITARWRTPDHRVRQGLVELGTAARAGQQVRVWTNAGGRLTGPPVSRQAIQLDVTLAVLLAPAALAVVLLMTASSARLILNRRRRAGWDRAWAAAGPR
jgi:hypothetical protein